MIHSPELDQLSTALSKAQGEFESVAKNASNPFFKSRYAALPAVVEAATPILTKHGLAISQHLGHDEHGDTLTTMVLHSSGQYLGDTMHLRPVKDDPQAQGSATTYGRRYAYMAALGLVADEDDDGNAASGGRAKPKRTTTPAKPKTIGAERAKRLRALCDDALGDEDALRMRLTAAGSDDPTDIDKALAALTPDQAAALRKDLPQ